MDKFDNLLESIVVEMLRGILPESIGSKTTARLLESYSFGGGSSSERVADEDENFDNWLSIDLGNFRTLGITSQQAKKLINTSRAFWQSSEIYKNALWNRRNFILGSYVSFDLMPLGYRDMEIEKIISQMGNGRVKKFTNVWQRFWQRNNMWKRLNSWATKRDRDGNVLLRLFGEGNDISVRFIDPMQILDADVSTQSIPTGGATPRGIGIVVAEDDIETVLGYMVRTIDAQDGGTGETQFVSSEDVVFDKVSEDYDSILGVPLAYPCFTNIRRAEKLLLNASTLTQIQTAIALIRKHNQGTSGAAIAGFANRNATGSRKDKAADRDIRTKRMTAGTILDAKQGTEYDFPAHAVKADGWVTMTHEELSRVAACHNIPVDWLLAKEVEFPLNPGSPFLRGFHQDRQDMFQAVEDLYWRVQERAGMNIEAMRQEYELVITAPVIPTAKTLDQARTDDIYIKHSAKSPQQVAREQGTRYELMRSEIIKHRKTKQEGEQFPGDAGMTQVDNNQNSDGMTKSDGTTKTADGDGGNNNG